MSYIDIGIIAIIVLGALIGLWKGFGKTFMNLILTVAAIAVAFLFARQATDFLMSKNIINNFIIGESASLSAIIRGFLPESLSTLAIEKADLSNMGILGLLVQPMLDRYIAIGGNAAFTATMADVVSVTIALNVLTIIIALLIYAVARIVVSIVKWILGFLLHGGSKGLLSRLFGFLFGAVKGGVTVVILLYIATIIPFISQAQTVTDMIDKGVITQPAMNFINKVVDKQFNKEDRLGKILKDAGYSVDAGAGESDGSKEDPNTEEPKTVMVILEENENFILSYNGNLVVRLNN